MTKSITETQKGYLFTLSAADVAVVWPFFMGNITHNMNFKTLAIQILSYNTTIEEITKDSQIAALSVKDTSALVSLNQATKALEKTSPVRRGATLFAEIEFGSLNPSKSMNDAISLTADTSQTPTTAVTLFAHVDPKADKTVFSVKINHLVLFGGSLIIDGEGFYNNQAFMATATMEVHDLVASPVYLDVKLTVRPNATLATMQLNTTAETIATAPLGMFNVELSHLAVSVSILKDPQGIVTRLYGMDGQVRLGLRQTDSTLTGKVFFEDGKPRCVAVIWSSNSPPFSIDDLFQDIVKPGEAGSGNWPTEYDHFCLENVTLSYVRGDTPFAISHDKIAAPGFNAKAALRLFKAPFAVTVNIPSDRKGVLLKGVYMGIIDLDFAKIIGYKQLNSTINEGISLAIDTRHPSGSMYELKAGFEFFEQPDFFLALSYNTRTKLLAGTLTYDGEFMGFKSPRLVVQYNTATHVFTVSKLPCLEDISRTVMALEHAMSEGSAIDGNSSCGKIADFVFDKVVTTKFTFDLHGLTKDQDSPVEIAELTCKLDCHYEIYVTLVQAEPVCTIDIGSFDVDIPKPFSVHRLKEFFINFVTANVANIGKAFLDRPDEAAKLMGFMAADAFKKDVLGALLCRGINDAKESMSTRGKAEAEAETTEANASAVEAGEAAAAVATTATTAEGAAAAYAAAGAAVGIAGVLIERLSSNDSIVNKISKYTSDEEKAQIAADKEEARRNYEAAQQQLAEARIRFETKLDLSGVPSVTIIEDVEDPVASSFKIDWSQVLPHAPGMDYNDYRGFSWEIKYSTTSSEFSESIPTLHVVETSTIVLDSDISHVPHIWGWVRAVFQHNEDTFHSIHWAAGHISHIPKMRPSIKVGLTNDASLLHATITNLAECEQQAKPWLVFNREDGVEIDDKTNPISLGRNTSTEVTWTIAYFPDTVMQVRVSGTVEPPNGDGSIKRSIQVFAPETVSILPAAFYNLVATVHFESAVIDIKFDQRVGHIATNTNNLIEVFDVNRTLLLTSVQPPRDNYSIDMPGIVSGQETQLTVAVSQAELPPGTVMLRGRCITTKAPIAPFGAIWDERYTFYDSQTGFIYALFEARDDLLDGVTPVFNVEFSDAATRELYATSISGDGAVGERIAKIPFLSSVSAAPKRIRVALERNAHERLTGWNAWSNDLISHAGEYPFGSFGVISADHLSIVTPEMADIGMQWHYSFEVPKDPSHDYQWRLINRVTTSGGGRGFYSEDNVMAIDNLGKHYAMGLKAARPPNWSAGPSPVHTTMLRTPWPSETPRVSSWTIGKKSGLAALMDRYVTDQPHTGWFQGFQDENGKVRICWDNDSTALWGDDGRNSEGTALVWLALQYPILFTFGSRGGGIVFHSPGMTKGGYLYHGRNAAAYASNGGALTGALSKQAGTLVDLWWTAQDGRILCTKYTSRRETMDGLTAPVKMVVPASITEDGVAAIAHNHPIDTMDEIFWVDHEGGITASWRNNREGWLSYRVVIDNKFISDLDRRYSSVVPSRVGAVHAVELRGQGTLLLWVTKDGGIMAAHRDAFPDTKPESVSTMPWQLQTVAPPGFASPTSVLATSFSESDQSRLQIAWYRAATTLTPSTTVAELWNAQLDLTDPYAVSHGRWMPQKVTTSVVVQPGPHRSLFISRDEGIKSNVIYFVGEDQRIYRQTYTWLA